MQQIKAKWQDGRHGAHGHGVSEVGRFQPIRAQLSQHWPIRSQEREPTLCQEQEQMEDPGWLMEQPMTTHYWFSQTKFCSRPTLAWQFFKKVFLSVWCLRDAEGRAKLKIILMFDGLNIESMCIWISNPAAVVFISIVPASPWYNWLFYQKLSRFIKKSYAWIPNIWLCFFDLTLSLTFNYDVQNNRLWLTLY